MLNKCIRKSVRDTNAATKNRERDRERKKAKSLAPLLADRLFFQCSNHIPNCFCESFVDRFNFKLGLVWLFGFAIYPSRYFYIIICEHSLLYSRHIVFMIDFNHSKEKKLKFTIRVSVVVVSLQSQRYFSKREMKSGLVSQIFKLDQRH